MFTRKRLLGFWILGSVVDPEEFEGFDHDIALAIDGRGGTYAPTDPIVIGGDGLDLADNNHVISGTLTIQELAQITIANGATIKAEGSASADILLRVVSNVARIEVGSGAVVQVKTGGALDIHGAITLKDTDGPGSLSAEDNTTITGLSGSTLTMAAGSTTNLNGATSIAGAVTITEDGSVAFGNGSVLTGAAVTLDPAAVLDWEGIAKFADLRLENESWITLTTARDWERHSLLIAWCTYNNHAGAGPDDPDAWTAESDLSTSMCLFTRGAGATGDYTVVEFKDLPPGGAMTSVKVKTKGTTNNPPVFPKFQIVRWLEGDDLETLSSEVTDAHEALSNWDTLSRTTTISVSGGTHTIDKSYRYGLKIKHPYASVSGTSAMQVYDVGAYGTVNKIQAR